MRYSGELNILFVCKKGNLFAERVASWLLKEFPNTMIFAGDRNEPLPDKVVNWSGDIILSFMSSWIFPPQLLNNARLAAINFHPGSPEYPGTGCTNFAVYNNEKEYGVTCHHMKSMVDTGSIIMVKRFTIKPEDSVYSITQHCYQLLEEIFYEVMECFREGKDIPVSTEKWKRKPYTRKELNELCEIKPDMSKEEVERRIRATTYEFPWAFTRINGHVFKLQQ